MKHPQDKHENTQRLKLMLLAGQVLTKRYLDRLFDVTNSAEMVNRLRKAGMNIITVMKRSKSGKIYGEYRYVPPSKQSRITNKSYLT
jgi:hypothetical protein